MAAAQIGYNLLQLPHTSVSPLFQRLARAGSQPSRLFLKELPEHSLVPRHFSQRGKAGRPASPTQGAGTEATETSTSGRGCLGERATGAHRLAVSIAQVMSHRALAFRNRSLARTQAGCSLAESIVHGPQLGVRHQSPLGAFT
eukprot:scaffold12711_cov120-Isochrysis_galbana.AAC.6